MKHHISPLFMHSLRRSFSIGLVLAVSVSMLGGAGVRAITINPSDPFLSDQWYVDRLGLRAAWQAPSVTEDRVIVAVLDAGFDLDHPDLKNQYWTNPGEQSGNGVDDDQNGYVDDVTGWDFVENDPVPEPDTSNPFADTVLSHGTAVAGLIAAQANNGQGIVGVSPEARIMPLRVLGEHGVGTVESVREAIYYAVENGADVINLSFTFSTPDPGIQSAIAYADTQGVVIVAAAGNDGQNSGDHPVYPACYDQHLGRNIVIGVSAVNKQDAQAGFSNFGGCTDVSAPGTDLLTTVFHEPDNRFLSVPYGGPWEGTSLSAPIVSGAAALLLSVYPSLTPDQVRLSIKLPVDPVQVEKESDRHRFGAGRLNVQKALDTASVYAGATLPYVSDQAPKNDRIDTSSGTFVVGQGAGGEPIVRRFNAKGNQIAEFHAYDAAFRGGVRVAMGDVNGDGIEEIVTGAGPGGGPQVRVFSLSGQLIGQFFAFSTDDRSGITIETGDLNADGTDEILVTKDRGNGQLRIFDLFGNLQGSFDTFKHMQRPVSMSTIQADASPAKEILTVPRGSSRARIHDGSGRFIREIDLQLRSAKQLQVAAGNLDGVGPDEIIIGSGEDDPAGVSLFSATGELINTFRVFPNGFRGGVHVAAADLDKNGVSELLVAPLKRGGPHAQLFFGTQGDLLTHFFAFDPAQRFGIQIGGWNP